MSNAHRRMLRVRRVRLLSEWKGARKIRGAVDWWGNVPEAFIRDMLASTMRECEYQYARLRRHRS